MPTDHDPPTTADRRHVGHHERPYTDLAIDDAEGTMAAAQFANLLSRQAAIPNQDYQRGFRRWYFAMNAGEESQALKAAPDAIREVEDAKHPHAVEIATLIQRITGYVETLAATRDARRAVHARHQAV